MKGNSYSLMILIYIIALTMCVFSGLRSWYRVGMEPIVIAAVQKYSLWSMQSVVSGSAISTVGFSSCMKQLQASHVVNVNCAVNSTNCS